MKEEVELSLIRVSWYLGVCLGLWEELDAWVKPKVKAWANGVTFLSKIAKQHPQLANAVLGMLLQLEWQYLQSTSPLAGTQIGPIGDSLMTWSIPRRSLLLHVLTFECT